MPASQLDIPAWDPPRPTQQKDIDWAPLWTLDLSQITGDNFTEVPSQLVSEAAEALSRDGFIYAINHGLSWDQVLRQFAIGQHAFKGVPQEDKEKFKADILERGSFAGYKQQGHWRLNGIKDTIEQYNVVSTSFADERQAAAFPPALVPFIPEIRAFAKFNHEVIYRKILSVLSLVLKLPADYLWKLSKEPEQKGLDLLRYGLYHAPPSDDDEALGGVRLQGHTDFNAVTLLWSQPITSLEVLMPSNEWKFARHIDNALVINLGDAMHFLSGGFFKATIHRVVAPPKDQAHYERLGLFDFMFPNASVPLEPLLDSSVVRESYKGREDFWKERKARGESVPTAGEWEQLRVRAYGQEGTKKRADGHESEKIAGVEVTLYNSIEKKKKQQQQLEQQLEKLQLEESQKAQTAGA